MFKKILNCLILFFIILLGGTLAISLVNYFNIMDSKVVSIMKFMLPMISILASSYRLGKFCNKLGYLEGAKFGGLISLIFIFLVIILDKISLRSILYYGILVLVSIMGSMIGINRKKLKA